MERINHKVNANFLDVDFCFLASEVVRFWRSAGPERWFAKDPNFDDFFRNKFIDAYHLAYAGELDNLQSWAEGALALTILLDQFPRNSFRGTPKMYATDDKARTIARRAINASMDIEIDPILRRFFYLPFSHSECISDQEFSVELHTTLGAYYAERAEHHKQIIARFGRFPHRNVILCRDSTFEEKDFLASGGFSG